MSSIDNHVVSLFSDSFLSLPYEHQVFVKKAFHCIAHHHQKSDLHEVELYAHLFYPLYNDAYINKHQLHYEQKIKFLRQSISEWDVPKNKLELVNYYAKYYKIKPAVIQFILSFYYQNLSIFIESNRQTKLSIMKIVSAY